MVLENILGLWFAFQFYKPTLEYTENVSNRLSLVADRVTGLWAVAELGNI